MKNIFPYIVFLYLFSLAGCGNQESSGEHLIKRNKLLIFKNTLPRPIQDTSYLEYVFAQYNLVNLRTMDSSIQVDLRYADTANFLKINLYDGLRNAYLNCDAAIKVCNAQYFLKQKNKNYSLLILDAARPLHIQQLMWDSTRLDTVTKRMYLAMPHQTSLHNYGCAVDVTIIDMVSKKELDMGTPFDTFSTHSKPSYEQAYLRDSSLSRQAYENRLLLRSVMKQAGLNPITSEWWHFSICNKEEAVLKYKLIK